MSNIRNLTYQQLKEQKELMVNAMAFSICDMDREIFQKAIQGIEDEMYRRETNGSRILTAIVCCLVLLTILTGCQLAKESLHGGARCVGAFGRDVEWIGTKLADNIQTNQEK